MTLGQKVARGLKWQLINVLSRQVLSFVVFSLLARTLEPSAFGVMGLAAAYVAFVGLFANQGLGSALIQRRDLHQDHLHTAYWFNVGGAGVLCLATLAGADWFANFMREPALSPVVKWLSLSLLINALSTVHGTLLVKELDFRKVTLRALSANVSGAVVGIGMATGGYGVWALVGQQLAMAVANTVLLWWVSDFRPAFHFSLARLAELYRVSLSVFFTTLLWFFSSRIEHFLIGRLIGTNLLGHYTVADRIPDLVKMAIQQPLSEVSLPALSKLQTNTGRMCEAIYRGTGLLTTCGFPIFVGLALTAEHLIPLLFGNKWDDAGWICSLMAVSSLAGLLHVFFYPAMIARGASSKYLSFAVLMALTNLAVASLLFISSLKVMLIGMIVSRAALTLPGVLILRNLIGLSPLRFYGTTLVPLLGSLVMAAVVLSVTQIGTVRADSITFLIVATAAGAATYFSFSYAFNRTNLTEISGLLRRGFAPAAK